MNQNNSIVKNKTSNLNSVLLEGTVTTSPYKNPSAKASCFLNLLNTIYYGTNNQNELVEDSSNINIEVKGDLATSVFNHAKSGSQIRIVGRLRYGKFYMPNKRKTNTLYIVADHAELKPRK
jgi:single-stranded DNA-binding protein